ncbi:MAG TPA: hypothetical protein VF268_12375, partial [Gammaproteobacteria bacterium]
MPETAAAQAFYASRPKIELDGQDVPELGMGILSLSVEESTEGLYRAEITLGNWGAIEGRTDFLYFNRDVIDFGKEIAVRMGEGETLQEIFRGRITAIEGRYPDQRPPEILLLAEDSLQDLRMVRRTRSFADTTVGNVISQVAGAYNLATDIDIDTTQFSLLTQVNQSDLAFIRECARNIDAEVWIEDQTIKAKTRAGRRRNEITFSFGQRLLEFSVMADLARQRTALEVSGWDVASKSAVKERSENNALQNELDGGQSGPAILEEKFGRRVERIVHQVPFSGTEAAVMAKSA